MPGQHYQFAAFTSVFQALLQMDQTLHAVHEIQAEEQQGPEPGNGTLSPELSLSGVFRWGYQHFQVGMSWLRAWGPTPIPAPHPSRGARDNYPK